MSRPLLPAIVAACWLAALPATAAKCPQRCVHRGCASSARTKDMVRYTERMATHYRKPRDYRTLLDYPWHSGWQRYAWRAAATRHGGPPPTGLPDEGSYYREYPFPGTLHEVLPPGAVPGPVAPPSAIEQPLQPHEVVPPATPDRAARPRLRMRGPADGLSSPLDPRGIDPPRSARSVARPRSPVRAQ